MSGRFVVGLTGGIGSGKSAAAEEFARLGASVAPKCQNENAAPMPPRTSTSG